MEAVEAQNEQTPAPPDTEAYSLELPGGALEVLVPSFDWSQPAIMAVAHMAEGRYAATEVALAVGVPISRVRTWLKSPEFQAAVTALQQQMLEKYSLAGLARKDGRVQRTLDRLDRIQQIVEERAASAESPSSAADSGVEFNDALSLAPGGRTGLVAHQRRVIGSGAKAEVVDTFEVDAPLLKVEADLQKQVAMELGQWTEKTESTVVRKLYIGIDISAV